MTLARQQPGRCHHTDHVHEDACLPQASYDDGRWLDMKRGWPTNVPYRARCISGMCNDEYGRLHSVDALMMDKELDVWFWLRFDAKVCPASKERSIESNKSTSNLLGSFLLDRKVKEIYRILYQQRYFNHRGRNPTTEEEGAYPSSPSPSTAVCSSKRIDLDHSRHFPDRNALSMCSDSLGRYAGTS